MIDFPQARRITRIAQELASLSDSLPLNFSSSVFLRSDEDNVQMVKALITGPDDTPYSNPTHYNPTHYNTRLFNMLPDNLDLRCVFHPAPLQ